MQALGRLGVAAPRLHLTFTHGPARMRHTTLRWARLNSTSETQGDGNGSASDDGLPQEDVEVVIDFYTRKAVGGEAGREKVATPPTDDIIDGTPAEDPAPEEEESTALVEVPPVEDVSIITTPETTTESATEAEQPPHASSTPSDTAKSTDSASDEAELSAQQHRRKIRHLQNQCNALLASLDRGVAATSDDVIRVDNLVAQLESLGGPVVLGLTDDSGRSGMDLLNGRWRLVYSSGFAGGSLGGARPGPPSALVPLTLGAIYQDIFVNAGELDNVVTLTAKLSLASLPWVEADPPAITARLKHTFSIEGASTVRIVFENTVVKSSGGIGGWLDSVPQFATPELPETLRPSTAGARGATFDVTFLDERTRITRGDRGELRVFLRDV